MQNAKIKTQPRLAELGGVKNDRLKMKNSKSETLNSKQYRNPNAQNRKEEKGLGHLNFGNWNLFRIWDLEFRICNVCYSSLLLLFAVCYLLFTAHCLPLTAHNFLSSILFPLSTISLLIVLTHYKILQSDNPVLIYRIYNFLNCFINDII